MTLHEGEERLGIDGYPAEGGLFDSLLGRTALYSVTEDGWQFTEPNMQAVMNAISNRLGARQFHTWKQMPTGMSL